MKNAKFWLVQIAMVAILSLVFGSPVFADPSTTAVEKRQGSQSDNASYKNKANSAAQGWATEQDSVLVPDEETPCENIGSQMDADGNFIEVCLD